VHWLVVSLVISVVLTVAVNIALRAFPGLGDRIARSLTRLDSRTSNPDRGSERRTRVFVPWKAMIIASTSAFVDDALLPRLQAIAEKYGSRILVPSGAIGAIDAIASAAVLGLDEAVHQIVKPPAAWKGTPAEKLFDAATLREAKVFYEGSARQAAGDYPQNANATVVTSLAGIGIDRTRVQLVVDPAARINEHRIKVRGAFGELEIVLRNNPLATNPKSSELTALSLVRLIEQQGRTVVI